MIVSLIIISLMIYILGLSETIDTLISIIMTIATMVIFLVIISPVLYVKILHMFGYFS